jgi:redox-sensitive bicupin YhaK (pirin superfamily)
MLDRRAFLGAALGVAAGSLAHGCSRRTGTPRPGPVGAAKGDPMDRVRPVLAATPSIHTMEGAGVRLRRAFGFQDPHAFDPFLLLDDFRSDRPDDFRAGFPWHPHRGIETITYVLAGDVEHGDSLGNKGVIGAGDVQWMTAGGGIVHQEMPLGDPSGRMYGFQLWANLPASLKMTRPRYRDVRAAEIPAAALPGGIEARVVAGAVGKETGPVRDVAVGPEYLDFSLPPGAVLEHPVPRDRSAFAYVFGGLAWFAEAAARAAAGDDEAAGDGTLLRFGPGDVVVARAGPGGARFLLASGVPLREPIAWGGPIVMNTEAELQQAFREYREGTFLRHTDL